MADPVFNEEEIKAMLNRPVRCDNLEEIQQGAVQAMIDLFDRKVTREHYTGALAQALMLYGQCAKLWMLNSVHTTYYNNELSEQAFDVTYHGLKSMIERQQQTMTEVVSDLQKCPTSKDKVN